MHQQNIQNMYTAVQNNDGFNVIVIVSSSSEQAEYWQERLQASRGTVIGEQTKVISVEEDWPGGAGQLLGTLYAWNKAQTQFDLKGLLESGGSVAMYHTAGKGTRMAPLPAAEANNKSAIKLPRMIMINGVMTPITVLEAVIFQTGIFASSRSARLCVYWGDQVFIPSQPVQFSGRHHAEILDIRGTVPQDSKIWESEWQSYGLIIPAEDDEVLQREKQSWDDLQGLIDFGVAKPDQSGCLVLGKSLGSFSLSSMLLVALLQEFAPELTKRQGKMDTDPHLWMPLTSGKDDFISRGGDASHWDRIEVFRQQYLVDNKEGIGIFGDTDIGAQTMWWDYGQVQLYHRNFLKALENSFEGKCLRGFYDLEKYWIGSASQDGLKIENSILVDTQVMGKVQNSLLVGVGADDIDITDSVIISSTLSNISADSALVYNCADLRDMQLPCGEVLADVIVPGKSLIRMRTQLTCDGKEDWETTLPGNKYSFESLCRLVANSQEE